MDQKTREELIDALIEKRICVSKAQARRMILAMPEEQIRKRIDRVTAPTTKVVGFYEVFRDYLPSADSASRGSSPSP